MTQHQLKEMAGRIKARRSALHFTQEQFAEFIDITASSYTKIENAFQKPSLDTLIKIAEKLNLSLDYLVFGKYENKKMDNTKAEMVCALLDFADQEKILHAGEVLHKLAQIKKDSDQKDQG